MSSLVSESTTTWDTARTVPLLSWVRERQAPYVIHPRTPEDFVPVFSKSTTSTDVQFLLGETSDWLWDTRARTVTLPIQDRVSRPRAMAPNQAERQGPLGGRLISLVEACRLADEALFAAERERQEARERDALFWSDLEDET